MSDALTVELDEHHSQASIIYHYFYYMDYVFTDLR